MDAFINKTNPELYGFFPEGYFSSSHAPIINIFQNVKLEEDSIIKIHNNTFSDQENF
jgi:hypothetical protein